MLKKLYGKISRSKSYTNDISQHFKGQEAITIDILLVAMGLLV